MFRSTPPVARRVGVAVLLLAIVAAIALLGSLASSPNIDGWYASATKVPWNPPNWVFGPAWSLLYLLIAYAGYLIWRAGYAGRSPGPAHSAAASAEKPGPNSARKQLRIYAAQLILNASWTPVFFAGYPLIGEAAWWVALAIINALVITVVWLTATTFRISKPAAWMLIPYLLWLTFATTLNAGIIALN